MDRCLAPVLGKIMPCANALPETTTLNSNTKPNDPRRKIFVFASCKIRATVAFHDERVKMLYVLKGELQDIGVSS